MRSTWIIGAFLAVLILAAVPARTAYAETCGPDVTGSRESVVLREVGEAAKPARQYSERETQVISEVKKRLIEFWKSKYAARYRMLTDSYKERLKQSGLKTAENFAGLFDAEIYACLTFRAVELGPRRAGGTYVQISADMDWISEGYEGVQTFIFEFVQDNGQWKINSIVK